MWNTAVLSLVSLFSVLSFVSPNLMVYNVVYLGVGTFSCGLKTFSFLELKLSLF